MSDTEFEAITNQILNFKKQQSVRETSEISEKILFWSNGAGDLFDPHNIVDGEAKLISEKNLPPALKSAWNNLWSDNTGSLCYLVEIEGDAYPYNIALCNEYSKEDDFSHEDVIKRGAEAMRLMKTEGIDGTVYAGLSDEKYRSDDYTDELMVIMPAGISKEKFDRVADFLLKAAYVKDVTYEMYKEHPEVNAFNKDNNSEYETDVISRLQKIYMELDAIQELDEVQDNKEMMNSIGEAMGYVDNAIDDYSEQKESEDLIWQ